MTERENISQLFKQRALEEIKKDKYAGWAYAFHVCVPWLSVCGVATLNHFLKLDLEVHSWIFMIAVSLYFFFSWLWWKKMRVSSRKIALIDKKISQAIENSNF